jgi:hypothetical protein
VYKHDDTFVDPKTAKWDDMDKVVRRVFEEEIGLSRADVIVLVQQNTSAGKGNGESGMANWTQYFRNYLVRLLSKSRQTRDEFRLTGQVPSLRVR